MISPKEFTKRKNIGNFGEKIARKYLESKQYQIVGQNFYVRGGEIDLIAQKDGILVFVEVKTSTGKVFGGASMAMTGYKRFKLIKAIAKYLARSGEPQPWRLDFISIDISEGKKSARLRHFSNILAK